MSVWPDSMLWDDGNLSPEGTGDAFTAAIAAAIAPTPELETLARACHFDGICLRAYAASVFSRRYSQNGRRADNQGLFSRQKFGSSRGILGASREECEAGEMFSSMSAPHSPAVSSFGGSWARNSRCSSLERPVLWISRSRPLNRSVRATLTDDSSSSNNGFCIIESRDTVVDLAKMQFEELRDNVKSRRNKIFLLMEEVRRLRIQQRLKGAELGLEEEDEENDLPEYSSLFPFLPPLTYTTLKLYYATCFAFCGGVILFGGLLAPVLELRLGIGFTTYTDFIHKMHLPEQLSQVDPIVASFSGGAVGVISSLMVVEANNIRQQDKQRLSVVRSMLSRWRCSEFEIHGT
ncbi:protein ORANGE, chloroplastic isoform X2 [Selaginella moellendorffii]|uniref:protein ORANGE, chloroplastic isoform X2 n=1 Tax=Selaginella moellendorffii TaxID=88036 RepID=UPI000D1C81C4|nr:protein ORANGE, chloroplastic isoform X2 [Selaginella moellendorffii]|eukprot:XP_024518042.1 protein ORANGE, chloroplastic isoform X2 [Selaginella moellendorffii]